MELDLDDAFRDDDDYSNNDFYQERKATKEYVVYLVDVSPKMFSTSFPSENQKNETYLHIVVSCIAQSLKNRVINRSYDEVAICFFNTREKKNLQDLNGVFVFNVFEQEHLDRPTARFIREFDHIEESFDKEIGSQYGIISGSRENYLYNALRVGQSLLLKGSAKTAAKRILLFTNEDNPFGSIKGAAKTDMTRTTMQLAKDAQDLGISIELLPLCLPDEEFNVSHFFADMIGLGGDDLTLFKPSAGQKLEDMKNQLRKQMFTKRVLRRILFIIANGLSIELSTYALIRPTVPGAIMWLDSVTNHPLKTERSFICADTGALMQDPAKRFQPYKGENVKFSVQELSEIKSVSTGHLRLLGFKPLRCLKDYHNLRPSTFVFPSDKEVVGSTCTFIALHRSMLRLKRFAVAFYGDPSHPQLVSLVAQDEIVSAGCQVEPPGMHMIYLPFSDDIRPVEELHSDTDVVPRASDDQVKKAAALMKHIDMKELSVCQFANPSLRRHYAVLQALALEEDEMPEIKDETVPDEEGMARPGIVKVIEEFDLSVYGDNNYDEENDLVVDVKVSEASRKRKAAAENAAKERADYVWADLAENGKLKDLKVPLLKYYLMAHNLPHTGRKEELISRILTHMGKSFAHSMVNAAKSK